MTDRSHELILDNRARFIGVGYFGEHIYQVRGRHDTYDVHVREAGSVVCNGPARRGCWHAKAALLDYRRRLAIPCAAGGCIPVKHGFGDHRCLVCERPVEVDRAGRLVAPGEMS